jgi:hypothetical protein
MKMVISDLNYLQGLNCQDLEAQQLQGGRVQAGVIVYASARSSGNFVSYSFAVTEAYSGAINFKA